MVDPLQVLREHFSYVKEEDFIELLSLTYNRFLEPGEILIKSGERSWEISMILQGLMRSFLETPEGEFKTVLFKKEGELIGCHRTLIRELPSTETVEALEPTVMMCIDYRKFKKLTEIKPALNQVYVNYIEDLFMDAVDRVDDFTLRNPEERYLKFKEENPELLERAPQKYIASYLGITQQSLSRIRARIIRK